MWEEPLKRPQTVPCDVGGATQEASDGALGCGRSHSRGLRRYFVMWEELHSVQQETLGERCGEPKPPEMNVLLGGAEAILQSETELRAPHASHVFRPVTRSTPPSLQPPEASAPIGRRVSAPLCLQTPLPLLFTALPLSSGLILDSSRARPRESRTLTFGMGLLGPGPAVPLGPLVSGGRCP
ncbi:hypothetical protein EYF80_053242 [Liparis tanakae]|uniref:Uncharacterized protein n=1 Tax=Liparis tanakae TaxID=230148 RepID=A0A4Z2F688_9TELE|nr:hypothetical protein EYF80_053242 [Liparis tanakae]